MTQKEVVLNHLNSHVGLDTFTAVNEYGITRLSSVIFQLKEDGYDIVSLPKEARNPRGKMVRSCEYRFSHKNKKTKKTLKATKGSLKSIKKK